jgi:biotin carboxyl carrier protein
MIPGTGSVIGGWDKAQMAKRNFTVRIGEQTHELGVLSFKPAEQTSLGSCRVTIDGKEHEFEYSPSSTMAKSVKIHFGGKSRLVHFSDKYFGLCGSQHSIERLSRKRSSKNTNEHFSQTVAAPIPAAIISILVGKEDRVEKGQPLVVVSSMKMESTLRSPKEGYVKRINFKEGDSVKPKDEIIIIDDFVRE